MAKPGEKWDDSSVVPSLIQQERVGNGRNTVGSFPFVGRKKEGDALDFAGGGQ